MAKQRIEYGAFITYRPVSRDLIGNKPDTRPFELLPSLGIRNEESASAREESLARRCRELEQQGYRIEGIERWQHCARCHGTGKVQVKPRGWRRRSEPPWYLMRTSECRNCPGEHREGTRRPTADDGAAEAESAPEKARTPGP